MNKFKRQEFLKRMIMLVFGSAIIPEILSANISYTKKFLGHELSLPDNLLTRTEEYPIIDLHCHPSLKMYLLGKKFWKRHHLRRPGDNLIHLQEDVNEFTKGNVIAIIASHYLPEGGIKTQWAKIRPFWPLIHRLFFRLADKIEHGDDSNFTQINNMIDLLESQIHIANEKQDEVKFVIARSFAEFDDAIKQGKIPVVHSIEGAHALGKNMTQGLYVRNMEALKARGVCMITLGHFFENDLAYPVEGISPDDKKKTGMEFCYDPAVDDKPLKSIGIAVVKKMLEIGMIVDLTHSTPKARAEVFKINAERKDQGKSVRPLTFTHVGSQRVFEKHGRNKDGHIVFPNYNYYNVSPEDIKGIEDCNGVIGVIPENFWLAGGDTHLKKCGLNPDDFRYGIPYIIETIKDINSQTVNKDFDNVAIGTDFDGLADNPKDFYLNRHLTDLINVMKQDKDFTGKHIEKITSGNARRLLQNGWV